MVSSVGSRQALEEAFLFIDGRMTSEEVIKELVQIAGRPTDEPPAEKLAEEDDRKWSRLSAEGSSCISQGPVHLSGPAGHVRPQSKFCSMGLFFYF